MTTKNDEEDARMVTKADPIDSLTAPTSEIVRPLVQATGEWLVDSACVYAGQNYFFANVSSGVAGASRVERVAIAHLMAAAPDLLAALKTLWLDTRDYVDWSDAYRERIEAAIAKAEGR